MATTEGNNLLCPDCGRLKANSADEIIRGACPKWYAVRDPDARKDCCLYADRVQSLPLKIDDEARWQQIMALSDSIARRDEPPNEVEAALCGAVYRAKEWGNLLGQAAAALPETSGPVHERILRLKIHHADTMRKLEAENKELREKFSAVKALIRDLREKVEQHG